MSLEYIADLNDLLQVAKHSRSIELLRAAIEKEKVLVLGQSGQPGSTNIPPSEPSKNSRQEPKVYATRITQYGWDQSDSFVKIYITNISGQDLITSENVKYTFKNKSFELELGNVAGKSYNLSISDLCGEIIPDESSVKVKKGMVVINLRKAKEDKWSYLTAIEKKLKDSKELKSPKVDKDEDPGTSIMNLMKQMYTDGDDDMKRTIAKAWHETQSKRAHGEL